MINRVILLLLSLNLIFLGVLLLRPTAMLPPVSAQSPANSAAKDNEELARLVQEDQADRTPPAGKQIEWKIVGARDRARLARVRELYSHEQLQTAHDFFNIFQHATQPEDYLLAHELAVVAILKGAKVASLAAASEIAI